MANYQHKRSSVTGKTPLAGDLLEGEIAVNIKDRKLFAKDDQGAVFEFLGGNSRSVETINNVSPIEGNVTLDALNIPPTADRLWMSQAERLKLSRIEEGTGTGTGTNIVTSVAGKIGDVELNLSDIKVNGGTANNVVKAQLIAQGLSGNYGFFEEGFNYSVEGDIGIDADGNSWIYVGAGAPNKVVAAGTVPSAPDYEQVMFNNHNTLTNRNVVGTHAATSISIGSGESLQEYISNNNYKSVALMKTATPLAGAKLKTLNYYEDYPYGGAEYIATPLENLPSYIRVDELGNHTLGNGLIAVLQHPVVGEIDVHQYGAKGDLKGAQGTNDMYALRAALSQCKAFYDAEFTSWAGHSPTGWVLRLASKSYGLLLTQEDVDNGMDCALPISHGCGIKGAGRNLTNLVCMNGFVNQHVVANERWATKGADGYITLKDFTVWGRRWDGASPKDGVHINVSMDGYVNTDNYLRMSGIASRFCKGNGFYVSGRGEGMINDCQANNNQRGWVIDNYVDSMFVQCNAGGNRETGIKIYKASSSKFTNCKSYYNGADGGSDKIKCANWAVTADAWISGNITFTACESQESRGSGWYINTGLGSYIGCLAQDPKRAPIGSASGRPEVCAGFHLDKGTSGWSEQVARSNNFTNCTIIPGLALNYSDRKGKSFNGDYAVYIHPEAVGNTGNFNTYPQSRYDKFALGGGGVGGGGNPLLSVDGEYLIDGTPPSPVTIFVKSAVGGALKLYATQDTQRNHKVTDYKVEYKKTGTLIFNEIFLDVNQPLLIKDLETGSSYDLNITPVSKIGEGETEVFDSIPVSANRNVYIKNSDNLQSNYFISNKKLIDLDAPNIKFSFAVSDRTDLSTTPQSIIRQGTADDSEFELLVFTEYNYRLIVGGVTINGGVGKPLTSGTFDVVIQPQGLFIYKDGILEGANHTFVRGSKRVNNSLTYLMKGEDSITAFNPYKGAIRTLKTDSSYFEIDDVSGTQRSLEGDLTAEFTLVNNGGGGSWEVLPIG